MMRTIGTRAMGIRTPIIMEGDDLVAIARVPIVRIIHSSTVFTFPAVLSILQLTV